jgi:threonine-phosphate decarboxylase
MAMPDNLIDFSVNINPLGPPESIRDRWPELLERIPDYPDPSCRSLRNLIAREIGLSAEQILIGNGASELIHLLGRVFSGGSVLVVDPTFSEYRKTSVLNGCEVDSIQLQEANGWQLDADLLVDQLKGKKAVFICHPNNPTGVIYDLNQLGRVIKAAEKLGVTVVVDEAFYDFCAEPVSILSIVNKYSNLVVLRSLTKMYAVAGLRLGYLVSSRETVNCLKKFQPHWSVNALAQAVGELCLRDHMHRELTVRFIDEERTKMKKALENLDFVVSDSHVNYFLLRDRFKQPVAQLIQYLLAKGIVPRHTYHFVGLDGAYLRFAVKQKAENERLLGTLREWRER